MFTSFSTTSKLSQTPFHFTLLARNHSPFYFLSIRLLLQKTRGMHSSAKCSSAPSQASALKQSCMSSTSTSSALQYSQSLSPELWHQVYSLSLQFLGSILYQTGCECVLVSFCLVVMIIRALCPVVFLQNNWTMFF